MYTLPSPIMMFWAVTLLSCVDLPMGSETESCKTHIERYEEKTASDLTLRFQSTKFRPLTDSVPLPFDIFSSSKLTIGKTLFLV